jgi:cysteinyl-tRNA synthetase
MENSYLKLRKAIAKLDENAAMQQDQFDVYKAKFLQAVEDDMNTSMALTVVYEVLKADMTDKTKLALIQSFDEVLSLDLTCGELVAEDDGVDAELESFILGKIEERKAAKKDKDFAKADAIRDELLAKGIVLEDTREGVKWKKA